MTASAARTKTALWPLILITSLFFFWGVANNLNDVLIPQFKKGFVLTDLQSGLVQSAFYLGYFFLALPAAFVMRRFGYKAAVILGLLLYATGAFLFYPAAQLHAYSCFLGALFIIASGLAFLETSANPLITVLGPPESAAFRLNLAQSFNPLGALSGILIGQTFILSGIEHDESTLGAMSEAAKQAFYAAEVKAVQGPYLVIGLVILVWALLVLSVRFPQAATEDTAEADVPEVSMARSIALLFKRPRFVMGVVAQFFYVGAQVGIWSYMIRYAQSELGITDKAAASYVLVTLVLFWIGRVAGTALMRRVAPVRILLVFALCNIALTIAAISLGGIGGLYALVASSFFMSIMFPTIFAVAVEGLGALTKTASSFLVMAIVGGAVLTPIMGWVSGQSHIRMAFIVSTVCFIVVALFALIVSRPVKAGAAR